MSMRCTHTREAIHMRGLLMAISGCGRPQAQMEWVPLQEVEDPCMLVGLGHRHGAAPLVFVRRAEW